MIQRDRDSQSEEGTIDLDLSETPGQGGSSGGTLQREVGTIDEEKTAQGGDPEPTSVHKGQRPDGGDSTNLPNRGPAGDDRTVAPPRRT